MISTEEHCGFSFLGSFSHFLTAWCRNVTAQEAIASSERLCVLLEVGVLQVRTHPSCGNVGILGSGIGAQGLQEEPLLFLSSQP